MTAYDYPLLDVFWSLLIFAFLVVVVVLIIGCLLDNFRRRDHRGWAKAGWTFVILFIPVFGALVYIGLRGAFEDADGALTA